jgi:signal transduction histidine kinase
MSFRNEVTIEPGMTGPAAVLTSASPPTHCGHEVQFYFDDRFLIRSLSSFVQTALEAGSSAVIVATKSHREGLAAQLERAGVDLTEAMKESRYMALDAAETLAQFLVDGLPNETLFRELIGDVISCAADAAHRDDAKVVIFGEMVSLLWLRGETKAALQLEQFWNRLSDSHSFHLRCGYPITSFDREVHTELFARICGEHQVVIPAEGYSDLSDENDRLRTVARLQQTEQVLRTEAAERRNAQAQALEVQSQNHQLVSEIRKREAVEEELRRFTRRLLTARDEEQRRIAAELHENTAQLLAALSLYLGVLHEEKASLNPRVASVVASSRSVSESLLNEIRKLSHLLHPPTLDDMGLGAALREYVDQFTAASEAKVELEIPSDLGRFSRDLEIAVFRIVEEALTNTYALSGGYTATVRLTRTSIALIVEVQNRQSEAGGLDAVARPETRIIGIHERVMERGGTVQFTSDPSGTLLCVTLPLEAPSNR